MKNNVVGIVAFMLLMVLLVTAALWSLATENILVFIISVIAIIVSIIYVNITDES